MVKITACVITKNEEKNIEQWLKCMRRITKDLVVVDTGSQDRTVDIAREYGARIFNFAWQNDFAAAKNFAVDQAKGDWIVFLDADEYFTDHSLKVIRRYIEKMNCKRAEVDALVCKIINIDNDQNKKYISEFFNLRIFRNIPELRYKNPVHEKLERSNGKLMFCIIPDEIEIYHSGYSSSIIKFKLERNLKIILEEIAQIGEKPHHYRYLCECYFGLHQYEKSYHYACLQIKEGERSLGRDNHSHKRKIECMLILKYSEDDIMDEIGKAMDEFPDDRELIWYKGEYLFKIKRYTEAEQCFFDLINLNEKVAYQNDFSYTSLESRWCLLYYDLGAIAEYKGDIEVAIDYYKKSLGKYKYNDVALFSLIRLLYEKNENEINLALKIYYKENITDISFLTSVLSKFTDISAYQYYVALMKKLKYEEETDINKMLIYGYFAKASIMLADNLLEEYKKIIAYTIMDSSLDTGELAVLLPPKYQRVYKNLSGENVDLTEMEIKIKEEIILCLSAEMQTKYKSDLVIPQNKNITELCLKALQQGDYQGTLVYANEILEQEQQNPNVMYIIAVAAYGLRDMPLAEQAALVALKQGTKYTAETYRVLGKVYYEQGRYYEVEKVFKLALECVSGLKNDFSASLAQGLGHIYRIIGDSEQAKQYYFFAYEWSENNRERIENYSSYLLCCHYDQLMSDGELFKAHRQYQTLFDGITPYYHNTKDRQEKIRIGYLSQNFNKHVMNYFYWAMLSTYNHKQFYVICYSLGEIDNVTMDLQQMTDLWRNLQGLSYQDVAKIIFDDKIDILIDLGGHSANSGLPILAYKPAPVQISGLGYFNTTGLSAVDFFISDHIVDPLGHNDNLFTERLLRLPHSHFCYTHHDKLPSSKGTPYLQNGYITFGCFNQYVKVTDEMLMVWLQILKQIPASILLLKNQLFICADGAEATRQRLAALGFDLARVVLESTTPEYMQRYFAVDIALDTYPYPGGGTTCDALYMGVPVISMYGSRHGSRFGYSILKNIGLEELAVSNEQEYVRRAVVLAKDVELLDLLHKNLRNIMESSALMNEQLYMSELETAYKDIVER